MRKPSLVRVEFASPLLCMRSPLSSRVLRAVLSTMTERGGFPEIGELELRIVNDAEQARLNARFFGLSGPTNIISFPGAETEPACLSLSLPTIFRECVLYGTDPEERTLELLAHGVAHAAGYDHGAKMDAVCEELLAAGREALNKEAG